MQALMGEDQSQNTLQRLTGLREQLEKQEQNQQTEITVRHYHCDHLGTPLALTDQNQQIVWAARLDPWGNVEQEFNPHDIEQSIRLPGQHQDKETGLYYNRHRYYDPNIGAYVNQDPIGLKGGENLYSYAYFSPLKYKDTVGLNPVALGVCTAAAGIGYGLYKFFKKTDEASITCRRAGQMQKENMDWLQSTKGIGTPPHSQQDISTARQECTQQAAEAAVQGATLPSKPVTSTGSILGKVVK